MRSVSDSRKWACFGQDRARQVIFFLLGVSIALNYLPASFAADISQPVPLVQEFERDIASHLLMPAEESQAYGERLKTMLLSAEASVSMPQFVILVDRSVLVQALFLYWGSASQGWSLVGATQVSTGLPGTYEHFLSPLGVFDHTMANPDFRAKGTKNKNGFRGYGKKGMRIYDFGWVGAQRGWGDGSMGVLRLQMHATDPDRAESRLGTPQSEGCVRIPAALNDFIDRYALLDEDYERAVAGGSRLWVLRRDRTPTSSPGRYLVVIDSQRRERPVWSPSPVRH